MLLERAIGVVHIRRVVLVVMDFHRLRIDVWLECVECVRKRRNLICHGGQTPLLTGCDLDYENQSNCAGIPTYREPAAWSRTAAARRSTSFGSPRYLLDRGLKSSASSYTRGTPVGMSRSTTCWSVRPSRCLTSALRLLPR